MDTMSNLSSAMASQVVGGGRFCSPFSTPDTVCKNLLTNHAFFWHKSKNKVKRVNGIPYQCQFRISENRIEDKKEEEEEEAINGISLNNTTSRDQRNNSSSRDGRRGDDSLHCRIQSKENVHFDVVDTDVGRKGSFSRVEKIALGSIVRARDNDIENHFFDSEIHSGIYESTSYNGGRDSIGCPYTRNVDFSILSLDEAMQFLEKGSFVQPSVEDITDILQRCIKERKTSHMLSYICNHGLETHPMLGNQAVSILLSVGGIMEALEIFNRLNKREESNWNSLITGLVGYGESQLALALHEEMMDDVSVCLSSRACVSLLKACTDLKDFQRAQKLHSVIKMKGLVERDVVVGNALMNMYIKLGSLKKAEEVFDTLPFQNVISWNTLISGYNKNGFGNESIRCFGKMQQNGFVANTVTFICVLKACGRVGNTVMGQEIHADIARRGLSEKDVRVGTALVDMYGKGGWLINAREVFNQMSARNTVSWNALLSGYIQHGYGEEALNWFDRMQLEGICPDGVTFICSLKACTDTGATSKGQEIHARVNFNGLLNKNQLIGSALVNMYAKAGLFEKAKEVLEGLSSQDVVSWTALIAGYAENGCGEEALKCFETMKLEGVTPNSVTLVCVLKACGTVGDGSKGQEIHDEIMDRGLLRDDPGLGSTLVDMYVKCGMLDKAAEVFEKLPDRNVVAWNALITGYCEYGCYSLALNCFDRMQVEGILPDDITYVCTLKACGTAGNITRGQRIHSQFIRKGLLCCYLAAGNALVDMYAKCGMLDKAQELFDELPNRDIVTWNALISGYVQFECGEKAFDCVEQMQAEGFHPDVVTSICILKASGNLGAAEKGQTIYFQLVEDGLLEGDTAVANAVIDMYAKCGILSEAQKVFDSLSSRDLVSWTSLIAGYAQLGDSKNVFKVFHQMVSEGLYPNLITFVSILNTCSHTGLIEKGLLYFEAMKKEYGIIPASEHYTCVIDLLCRAGQIEYSVAIIDTLSFLPDIVAWNTVLGACQRSNNEELARYAFEHALHIDESDPGAYVCMSNIFADVG